jgi:zinc D-Ala-D-Ala carboxypeptidase
MPFSRFFTLAELTHSNTAVAEGIPNQPGPAETAQLQALCAAVLDPLRAAVGQPIKVNSGYRGPQLNRRIGGAPGSQHQSGQAADIQSPAMPVLELFKTIIRLGLPFDQLIYEARNATSKWVHVSHDPARRRGEIRVAEFDASGRPVRYPIVSAEQALAMTERVSRSRAAQELIYEERGDEPAHESAPVKKAPAKKAPAKKASAGKTAAKAPAAKKVAAKKVPAKKAAARSVPTRTAPTSKATAKKAAAKKASARKSPAR